MIKINDVVRLGNGIVGRVKEISGKDGEYRLVYGKNKQNCYFQSRDVVGFVDSKTLKINLTDKQYENLKELAKEHSTSIKKMAEHAFYKGLVQHKAQKKELSDTKYQIIREFLDEKLKITKDKRDEESGTNTFKAVFYGGIMCQINEWIREINT